MKIKRCTSYRCWVIETKNKIFHIDFYAKEIFYIIKTTGKKIYLKG